MKMLLWKEWRENRFFFLGVVVLTIVWVSLAGWMALTKGYIDIGYETLSCFDDLLIPLLIIMSAVLGAGLISSEFGSGRITFLLSLPLKRKKVWLIKFFVGISELSLLLAILLTLAMPVWRNARGYYSPTRFWAMASWCLLTYSVTFFFSTLLDRALLSFFTGAISSWALYFPVVLVLWRLHLMPQDSENMEICVLAISGLILGAAFAVTSLIVFKRRKV